MAFQPTKLPPLILTETAKPIWLFLAPHPEIWCLLNSTTGFSSTQFGISEDIPAQADYDGNGRADLAVFHPSTGLWYVLRSERAFGTVQFGISGDAPTPGAFVP